MMGPDSYSAAPSDRKRTKRHKLKHKVPSEYEEKILYCAGDRTLEQVGREIVEFLSVEIFKTHLYVTLHSIF